MKNSRQRDLLIATAQRHGLTLTQAEEIWASFGFTIAKHISSNHRGEDNKFVLDKFPVIHIEHFGKFIPNKKRINYANYCIDKNKTDDTQDNPTDSSVS